MVRQRHIVQFIHETVKDFLDGTQGLQAPSPLQERSSPEKAHTHILECCLASMYTPINARGTLSAHLIYALVYIWHHLGIVLAHRNTTFLRIHYDMLCSWVDYYATEIIHHTLLGDRLLCTIILGPRFKDCSDRFSDRILEPFLADPVAIVINNKSHGPRNDHVQARVATNSNSIATGSQTTHEEHNSDHTYGFA